MIDVITQSAAAKVLLCVALAVALFSTMLVYDRSVLVTYCDYRTKRVGHQDAPVVELDSSFADSFGSGHRPCAFAIERGLFARFNIPSALTIVAGIITPSCLLVLAAYFGLRNIRTWKRFVAATFLIVVGLTVLSPLMFVVVAVLAHPAGVNFSPTALPIEMALFAVGVGMLVCGVWLMVSAIRSNPPT